MSQVSSDVAVLAGSDQAQGYRVSGPAKLGQRYLLELLTVPGSLLANRSRGSSFALAMSRRNFTSESDLLTAFTAAQPDLLANLQGEETDQDPADERVRAAVVRHITLAAGRLDLTVLVVSRSGARVQVGVPFAWSG